MSLGELRVVGLAGAGVQLAVALWLSPALLPFLALTWGYMALMGREFFVGEWLKAHPIAYMVSHMLVMPLIDLYATACDWRTAGAAPPEGLVWFLLVSFFNGMTLEIGRKIRSPEQEEEGVETYTVLWGRRGAAGAWLGALATTACIALLAARQVGFLWPAAAVLGALLLAGVATSARFVRRPDPGTARAIETLSGVWTLAMYLMLGAAPRLSGLLGSG